MNSPMEQQPDGTVTPVDPADMGHVYPYMIKRADKPLASHPPIDYAMDLQTASDIAADCADELRGVWFQIVNRNTNEVVSSVRLPRE